MSAANFSSGTVWTGDNLPVMRGINSSCIDLIYLDPPFNSNEDYAAPIGSQAAGSAFKDTWTLSDVDVYEHGELAERNPAAYKVIDAARDAHGKAMMSYLIMMAVRLLECHRILKVSGSLYLHCDDAASHYLKLLMDSIFGASRFRNEIAWRRIKGGKNDAGQYGRNHDRILFYTKSDQWTFFPPRLAEINDSWYKKQDERGRYVSRPLLAAGATNGDSGQPWRGVLPKGHWIVPRLLGARYEREQGRELRGSVRERLEILAEAGYIEFSGRGNPSWRRYLSEANPPRADDMWHDDEVKPISRNARERTGYPTQKPLALLDRIMKASSRPGDLVFDPFCGCATALVAAHLLERQWAGCDISENAVRLTDERIRAQPGSEMFGGCIQRDEPPHRSDLGLLPNYRTQRHRLYGEQEGDCAGCKTRFPFKVMEVVHILPKSKGGSDHRDNLQLLCSHCNRSRGSETMAEWRARLN